MKRIFIAFLCVVFLFSFIISATLFAADNVFNESGYGYILTYPEDWTYIKKTPHIIVFTKKAETNVNTPVVGVQNLLSTKMKDGKYKDVNAVIADFENQLRITQHAKVYPAEIYTYSKNGIKLTGRQFIAEYIFKDKNYKQLMIAVSRKNGEVFHVWIYSAQAEQYDKYFPTVRTMLDSWVIAE
ncbi:MAG: PsbP-related protein [Proteobacteria bacterium]|nr:PsbP-related protein [Pseudomonadota bacterium]